MDHTAVPRETCDHCQRPRRALKTHILPITLRPPDVLCWRPPAIGRTPRLQAACLVLCDRCSDQRRQDIRAFLKGHAPTELVCLGSGR